MGKKAIRTLDSGIDVRATSRTGRGRPVRGGSPGAVTIEHVARRAGVSASTVSRILAGQSRQPRGRNEDAVRRAVEELGYRTHAVARSMRTGSTALLGVLVDNLVDPVFPKMVRAMIEAAERSGYGVVLGTAPGGPDLAEQEVEKLLARGIDGLIVACSWPASAIGIRSGDWHLPLVLANTDGPGAGHVLVGSDNLAGARLAAAHLLALGHSKIAYVRGPSQAPFDSVRLAGIRDEMRGAGLSPDTLALWPGDGTVAGGRAAAERMQRAPVIPTGVIAYNDLTAIGLISGLASAGIHVPSDISVMGIDDIAEAAWMDPPLTTIHQDSEAIGRVATEILVELLAGSDLPAQPRAPRRLPVELVVRASTAPARSAGSPTEAGR